MRFTLAWLKEYLEFDSSIDSLCQKLTSIGLEVEEVKNPKNDLNKLKFAYNKGHLILQLHVIRVSYIHIEMRKYDIVCF